MCTENSCDRLDNRLVRVYDNFVLLQSIHVVLSSSQSCEGIASCFFFSTGPNLGGERKLLRICWIIVVQVMEQVS